MHDFTPVEPGIDQCGVSGPSGIACGLPAAHGRHPVKAVAQPDETSRRRIALNSTLRVEANFHALVMDQDSPKARVFFAVACGGPAGATDDELYDNTDLHGLGPNTIRPRRIDLETEQLVTKALDDQGRIVKRPTKSGGWAAVWVLTDAAKHLLLTKSAVPNRKRVNAA